MSTQRLLFFRPPIFPLSFLYACGECSKKVGCLGFTGTLLTAWFPYRAGETLVFQTAQQERDSFFIAKDSASAPYRANVGFGNAADTGFARVSIGGRTTAVQKFSSLTLNNRSFTNVFAATRDTATEHTAGVFKVYYAKGSGIVAYTAYPSLKTWVKQ